ncbi:hypothetical protein H1V43_32225 [Streptomyces sp. PSKA54]|uniref:Uncharacterized protein n=1 Tax=Streptomyces himalayensis subsp. aureolus TaxID=2758039 RepID=A0A7W2D721_9ACTN|nr:hypothetical protein [Streptomyces himalayensis]MBA4865932.1 hypothetical protein [Streptomyces himalayensis subsp. aureolus]
MSLFRRSISTDELGESLTPEDREENATDYQASRGGWFKSEPKPTPGRPKA